VENFSQLTSKGFAFIVFFAPWCKHCKVLMPVFQELAKSMINTNELIFATVFLDSKNSHFDFNLFRLIVQFKIIFVKNTLFKVIQH
jgi:thiol-disulfide isomerase/thioredoxin